MRQTPDSIAKRILLRRGTRLCFGLAILLVMVVVTQPRATLGAGGLAILFFALGLWCHRARERMDFPSSRD